MTRDGASYTAGGVTSGIDTMRLVLADAAGEAVARTVQLAIEHDPASPVPGGTPDTAPPEIAAAVLAASTGR